VWLIEQGYDVIAFCVSKIINGLLINVIVGDINICEKNMFDQKIVKQMGYICCNAPK
jgi:hypothetical protein